MKKTVTLIASMLAASISFGQITITSTDMPAPTAAYSMLDIVSANPPNPSAGASSTWDYGSYGSTTSLLNDYYVETDTFYTHYGISAYYASFKSLNTNVGYNYYSENSFNDTAVSEAGMYVPSQGYDISAYTGSSGDSLNFPLQKILLSAPKIYIKFPFTAGSEWHTAGRRVVDFTLTVAGYSLDHTPGQHVYYAYRKDSVAGWGKMRVHTASGPSIYYDVLMTKTSSYNVDSFYLGGSPAPTTLLTAFGITQGQTTDKAYRYNFFRKGIYNYLLSFYYGNDATYTNQMDVYECTDSLTATTGINEIPGATFSTVLFPNPSTGSDVNLQMIGRDMNASVYTVTDAVGRLVQTGNVNMIDKNTLRVSLNNGIKNGNYFLHVADKDNKEIATEEFVLQR